MGADREPRRRQAVDAEGRGGQGHRARRPRSVEAARADDAHDRPRAARGSGLRPDHQALPREPGGARRGVREGLVQAAAPRHGTDLALPRSLDRGAAAVAGPGSGGRPRPGRRGGRRRPQGQAPRLRALDLGARLNRMGVGGLVPRHRQARRRERRTGPTGAAEGLGDQRAGRAGEGAARPRGGPAASSTTRSRTASGSRSPT